MLNGIGNTPLVKINKIHQEEGIECDMCKLPCNIFISAKRKNTFDFKNNITETVSQKTWKYEISRDIKL